MRVLRTKLGPDWNKLQCSAVLCVWKVERKRLAGLTTTKNPVSSSLPLCVAAIGLLMLQPLRDVHSLLAPASAVCQHGGRAKPGRAVLSVLSARPDARARYESDLFGLRVLDHGKRQLLAPESAVCQGKGRAKPRMAVLPAAGTPTPAPIKASSY